MDCFGSYVESFLGPNKSIKFVVDHESAEAVNCPADLLHLLPTTHPVSQVVNSAVQSFHVKHGQGSTTLTAMIWFWHQMLEEFRNQGMHLSELFSEIQTVVEDCILYLKKQSFSFEDYLIRHGDHLANKCVPAGITAKHKQYTGTASRTFSVASPSESCSKTGKNIFSQTLLQNSNVSVKRILQRSRHFQPSGEADDTCDKIAMLSSLDSLHNNIPPSSAKNNSPMENAETQRLMAKLVKGISHGDEERAALVLQAWKNQLVNSHLNKDDHTFRFNTDKFHVVSILGNPKRSTVISGLILPVSESMLGLVAETRDPCRALLLNCDLKFNYRHIGFKTSVNATLVDRSAYNMTSLSEEMKWHRQTLHFIKELCVNLLLVRGTIDPSLLNSCLTAKIVVIDNINLRTLNCLSSASSVPMGTYLDNCDKLNVLNNVNLTPWDLDSDANEYEVKAHILIQVSSILQTVVLCAPCHPLAYLQEHRLWHIAHRLASVTKPSGMMVSGGGKAESSCIKWMKQNSATSNEMKCAIDTTISVFQKFLAASEKNWTLGNATVNNLGNSVNSINDPVVIDDYFSKIEAWRSALVVAYLIANTQSVIYVGDQDKLCAKLCLGSVFEDL